MPGPPKKRSNTSQKTSALSKRHKTSKSTTSKTKVHRPAALADEPAKPVRATGSFPADKPSRESAKKDRKGKGPAFIPAVQQDSSGSESASDEDSDGDGDMEIDEDLEDMEQTDFLMKLDEKGMSV